MNENSKEAIPLSSLPYVTRRVRRGRPVLHVAAEAGLSSTVWARMERGEPVSLNSLILAARYLGAIIAIQPNDEPYRDEPDAPNVLAIAEEAEEVASEEVVSEEVVEDA